MAKEKLKPVYVGESIHESFIKKVRSNGQSIKFVTEQLIKKYLELDEVKTAR